MFQLQLEEVTVVGMHLNLRLQHKCCLGAQRLLEQLVDTQHQLQIQPPHMMMLS